jgi:hypothetical protein
MLGKKVNRFRLRYLGSIAFIVVIFIAAEVIVRASGLTNFPTYSTGEDFIYVVSPSQRGQFRNSNDWYFNNLSMPVREDWRPRAKGVLLIGNSIVMGGNSYRQADKITPLIEERLRSVPIWPVACGGWTQPNEIGYLQKHRELEVNLRLVAWEYMAGGLSDATPWAGEYVFPTHRPLWASYYAFRRYIVPLLTSGGRNLDLPATGLPKQANVAAFSAAARRLAQATVGPSRGFVWLYPTEAQLRSSRHGQEWLPERSMIIDIANRSNLRVVDLSRDPRWNETLYRDGTHPTVRGNRVLASILAGEINRDLQ